MAGCKSTISGEDFYGPYDAQVGRERRGPSKASGLERRSHCHQQHKLKQGAQLVVLTEATCCLCLLQQLLAWSPSPWRVNPSCLSLLTLYLSSRHTHLSAPPPPTHTPPPPSPPQELANANAAELGMQTVPSLNIAYTQEKGYVTADVAKAENLTLLSLSGTKFRKMLRSDLKPSQIQPHSQHHSSFYLVATATSCPQP